MSEEAVTFYAVGDEPLREVSLQDQEGSPEVIKFKNGKFETTNQLYIAHLTRLAETPEVPISLKPPRAKAAKRKSAKRSTAAKKASESASAEAGAEQKES